MVNNDDLSIHEQFINMIGELHALIAVLGNQVTLEPRDFAAYMQMMLEKVGFLRALAGEYPQGAMKNALEQKLFLKQLIYNMHESLDAQEVVLEGYRQRIRILEKQNERLEEENNNLSRIAFAPSDKPEE